MKGLMTVEAMESRQLAHAVWLVGAMCQVHRGIEFSCESSNAMTVVCVFMGHENRINGCRVNLQAGQTTNRVFDRKAEVNQQAGFTIVNDGTVALAAATQRCKTDSHGCLGRILFNQLQQALTKDQIAGRIVHHFVTCSDRDQNLFLPAIKLDQEAVPFPRFQFVRSATQYPAKKTRIRIMAGRVGHIVDPAAAITIIDRDTGVFECCTNRRPGTIKIQLVTQYHATLLSNQISFTFLKAGGQQRHLWSFDHSVPKVIGHHREQLAFEFGIVRPRLPVDLQLLAQLTLLLFNVEFTTTVSNTGFYLNPELVLLGTGLK